MEAISYGVPAFRTPQARKAATTLVAIGAIAITMFAGITALALALSARAEPTGNPSVLSQLAASSFGSGSVLFYLYQAATAGILVLAANGGRPRAARRRREARRQETGHDDHHGGPGAEQHPRRAGLPRNCQEERRTMK